MQKFVAETEAESLQILDFLLLFPETKILQISQQ